MKCVPLSHNHYPHRILAPRVTYSSDSSLPQRTCSLEEEPQAKGEVLVSSGAETGAHPPNSLLPHFVGAGPSGRKTPPGGRSSLNLRPSPATLSPSPRASVPHTACCKRFTA
ncbi:Pax3- And Pax7-Binding Protein 1 [Manis pentadactyla]|nr:Pax3- And Pax7-Binding Protein 1 [Manis pentadactyla]